MAGCSFAPDRGPVKCPLDRTLDCVREARVVSINANNPKHDEPVRLRVPTGQGIDVAFESDFRAWSWRSSHP